MDNYWVTKMDHGLTIGPNKKWIFITQKKMNGLNQKNMVNGLNQKKMVNGP